MFASREYICALRQTVKAAKLSAPAGFFAAGADVLQQCYNGIGPEAWSSVLRKFATWLLAAFEADALVHDWEFTFAPRTYKAFTAANWRFLRNGVRLATYVNKFNLRAVTGQAIKAVLLALLCQIFGWRGYKNKETPDA